MKQKLECGSKYHLATIFISLLIMLFILQVNAEVPTKPKGTYTTSWLGNTYMDFNDKKVVTESLNDICVSPNGKVFSAGYAEAWGGGASYNASDGSFAGRYAGSNSGFGDPLAVTAANDTYVYYGTGGYGLLRAAHGGTTGIYKTFLATKNIQGLYIKDGKLYVSDFGDGMIRILNISTMVEESSFACTNPTRLTVDNAGNIWVVIYDEVTSVQPPTDGPMWWGNKVMSFSPTGTPGPVISDFQKPLSVATNKAGQLLVGGLNENSQIWIYDVSGTPIKVGTFGEEKGIFGGTTAGQFTDSPKLHWIRSIAVDADDNIYTGCCYGTFWGNGIEKWNPTSKKLLWRLFAGTSLDCAGIDPENETEVYSKYHHYSLDYSKTTPGTEWSLKSFTVNRFKYPNDLRVDQNTDVNSRALGAGVYRIGGKLFVARCHQEGYGWELYRQELTTDGEVLVPSAIMAGGGEVNNKFYNATTKTYYYKKKKSGYNEYYCIAKNGDFFTVEDDHNYIVQYKYGGLDANSNPIWDEANATETSVPEFTYDIRKIYYDSDEDVMYITGDEPQGEWGTFQKIRRFDNWSKGNRKSTFTVVLPINDINYTPETGYGGGMPIAFSVAGDYMFVIYGYGHVRVLDKSDGSLVGTLVQDVANGWHGSQGQVDASYGMTAYKRASGEYIILFENAAWANIMMIRWCSDGKCSCNTPVGGISISTDTLKLAGSMPQRIVGKITPEDACNKNVKWVSDDYTVASVDNLGLVTGVKVGKTKIRVVTADGKFTDSCVVVINALPVSGVKLDMEAASVKIDKTIQLNASIEPVGATDKGVVWFSSDEKIAKVADGLVTGISEGKVNIIAKSASSSFADTCIVDVLPNIQEPYLNVMRKIPGEIQVEDYDQGGEGVAYHDNDSTNRGGGYRLDEGVDIEGNFNLGYVQNGEWLEFTVDVTPGRYAFQLNMATPYTGIVQVSLSGRKLCDFQVIPTGDWSIYTIENSDSIDITESGKQILRLEMQTADEWFVNIDWFAFGNAKTTGIRSGNLAKNGIEVFPNPTSQLLNIKFSKGFEKNVRLSITNMLSQKLIESTIPAISDNLYTVNVSKLKKGFYILNIQTDSGLYSKEIIIQ